VAISDTVIGRMLPTKILATDPARTLSPTLSEFACPLDFDFGLAFLAQNTVRTANTEFE
jgi:hypothetical protein